MDPGPHAIAGKTARKAAVWPYPRALAFASTGPHTPAVDRSAVWLEPHAIAGHVFAQFIFALSMRLYFKHRRALCL